MKNILLILLGIIVIYCIVKKSRDTEEKFTTLNSAYSFPKYLNPDFYNPIGMTSIHYGRALGYGAPIGYTLPIPPPYRRRYRKRYPFVKSAPYFIDNSYTRNDDYFPGHDPFYTRMNFLLQQTANRDPKGSAN